MPWYVFALVDAVPSGAKGKGLSGPLAVRAVPGGFAVVERRADVPPIELGSLKRHQEVLQRIAPRVPAILPLRFGTLLDDDGIEEALGERAAEISEAFDAVRGRVQFTWRHARRGTQEKEKAVIAAGAPASGSEYLRRAAKAARPQPPSTWRVVRAELAPLVAQERYQPAAGAAPESLYHLVGRDAVAQYEATASTLRQQHPRLAVSGPWPPFAFVPRVL